MNNMDVLCRLCTSSSADLVDLYHSENSELLVKIEKYLHIKCSQNENYLPHKVCTTCIYELDAFASFFQRCHSVQKAVYTQSKFCQNACDPSRNSQDWSTTSKADNEIVELNNTSSKIFIKEEPADYNVCVQLVPYQIKVEHIEPFENENASDVVNTATKDSLTTLPESASQTENNKRVTPTWSDSSFTVENDQSVQKSQSQMEIEESQVTSTQEIQLIKVDSQCSSGNGASMVESWGNTPCEDNIQVVFENITKSKVKETEIIKFATSVSSTCSPSTMGDESNEPSSESVVVSKDPRSTVLVSSPEKVPLENQLVNLEVCEADDNQDEPHENRVLCVPSSKAIQNPSVIQVLKSIRVQQEMTPPVTSSDSAVSSKKDESASPRESQQTAIATSNSNAAQKEGNVLTFLAAGTLQNQNQSNEHEATEPKAAKNPSASQHTPVNSTTGQEALKKVTGLSQSTAAAVVPNKKHTPFQKKLKSLEGLVTNIKSQKKGFVQTEESKQASLSGDNALFQKINGVCTDGVEGTHSTTQQEATVPAPSTNTGVFTSVGSTQSEESKQLPLHPSDASGQKRRSLRERSKKIKLAPGILDLPKMNEGAPSSECGELVSQKNEAHGTKPETNKSLSCNINFQKYTIQQETTVPASAPSTVPVLAKKKALSTKRSEVSEEARTEVRKNNSAQQTQPSKPYRRKSKHIEKPDYVDPPKNALQQEMAVRAQTPKNVNKRERQRTHARSSNLNSVEVPKNSSLQQQMTVPVTDSSMLRQDHTYSAEKAVGNPLTNGGHPKVNVSQRERTVPSQSRVVHEGNHVFVSHRRGLKKIKLLLTNVECQQNSSVHLEAITSGPACDAASQKYSQKSTILKYASGDNHTQKSTDKEGISMMVQSSVGNVPSERKAPPGKNVMVIKSLKSSPFASNGSTRHGVVVQVPSGTEVQTEKESSGRKSNSFENQTVGITIFSTQQEGNCALSHQNTLTRKSKILEYLSLGENAQNSTKESNNDNVPRQNQALSTTKLKSKGGENLLPADVVHQSSSVQKTNVPAPSAASGTSKGNVPHMVKVMPAKSQSSGHASKSSSIWQQEVTASAGAASKQKQAPPTFKTMAIDQLAALAVDVASGASQGANTPALTAAAKPIQKQAPSTSCSKSVQRGPVSDEAPRKSGTQHKTGSSVGTLPNKKPAPLTSVPKSKSPSIGHNYTYNKRCLEVNPEQDCDSSRRKISEEEVLLDRPVKDYKCLLCDSCFRRKVQLDVHYNKEHESGFDIWDSNEQMENSETSKGNNTRKRGKNSSVDKHIPTQSVLTKYQETKFLEILKRMKMKREEENQTKNQHNKQTDGAVQPVYCTKKKQQQQNLQASKSKTAQSVDASQGLQYMQNLQSQLPRGVSKPNQPPLLTLQSNYIPEMPQHLMLFQQVQSLQQPHFLPVLPPLTLPQPVQDLQTFLPQTFMQLPSETHQPKTTVVTATPQAHSSEQYTQNPKANVSTKQVPSYKAQQNPQFTSQMLSPISMQAQGSHGHQESRLQPQSHLVLQQNQPLQVLQLCQQPEPLPGTVGFYQNVNEHHPQNILANPKADKGFGGRAHTENGKRRHCQVSVTAKLPVTVKRQKAWLVDPAASAVASTAVNAGRQ